MQRLHDSSDGRDDLDPVCFHFCNVIAHATVTCLVYFLAVRLCAIRDALAAAAKASMPAAQEQQPLQHQYEGSPVDSMDRWAPAAVLGTSACSVHNLLTSQFLSMVDSAPLFTVAVLEYHPRAPASLQSMCVHLSRDVLAQLQERGEEVKGQLRQPVRPQAAANRTEQPRSGIFWGQGKQAQPE